MAKLPVSANFNAAGECIWSGVGYGDHVLPKGFSGAFSKRYALQEGVIVDRYPGKTDEEAEQLWLAEVAPANEPS